jgi:hypothetical protein
MHTIKFTYTNQNGTLETTLQLEDPTTEDALYAFKNFCLLIGFEPGAVETIIDIDRHGYTVNKQGVLEQVKKHEVVN